MISLERLEQSEEERAIRDDEVRQVVRWLEANLGHQTEPRQFIIQSLKRSAHRS